MKDNPLKKLGTLGQSIWLDYIRRNLITGGELRRLIDEPFDKLMEILAKTSSRHLTRKP
jgi:hypothetical protein